jgi:hypothetical protein
VSFLHYITGRLPEDDQARFEEQLLEDQEFSDAAAVSEQELIDAYALRRLDSEQTRAVALWIEASPERVERVALARAILRAAPQRGLRGRQIGAALAAAACVLVAATLYLVSTRTFHHEQKPTQLPAANSAPPIDQAPATGSAPSRTEKPDVVLIAAERIRSPQKAATYEVHRAAPIQLQVLLPGETAHDGYQVRLSPLDHQDKVLLQQNNLEAQSLAGQLYLNITLPPGSLPPATYTASVSRHGDTRASTFTVKWVHE